MSEFTQYYIIIIRNHIRVHHDSRGQYIMHTHNVILICNSCAEHNITNLECCPLVSEGTSRITDPSEHDIMKCGRSAGRYLVGNSYAKKAT